MRFFKTFIHRKRYKMMKSESNLVRSQTKLSNTTSEKLLILEDVQLQNVPTVATFQFGHVKTISCVNNVVINGETQLN